MVLPTPPLRMLGLVAILLCASPALAQTEKIEGVALIAAETVTVANDNDFTIGEFADGQHVGTGALSHLLVIRTRPIPRTDADPAVAGDMGDGRGSSWQDRAPAGPARASA